MWGFSNLKDFLDVLFVPSILFRLGVWLPVRLAKFKADWRYNF